MMFLTSMSFIVIFIQTISAQIIAPNVFVEGCIDLTCIKLLSRDAKKVSSCFETLRKPITHNENMGLNVCCNVRKYEECIFPLVIANCGLDAMDKFEEEMRSFNTICGIVTLEWNKCEVRNQTTTEVDESTLREV